MEGLLILLVVFYFLGMPLWLLILSLRVRDMRRQVEEGGAPITAPKGPMPDGYAPKVQQQPTESGIPVPAAAATTQKQEVPTPSAMKKASQKPAVHRSFEEQVGGHLFQWLGIGALIIALIVFLKWSFDNGLIGETGRTVLGYLFAAGAIAAGDLLRKKYDIWALTFTGGGGLASFIVTWIALHKYEMFSPTIGFGLFVLTTVVICLLAARYKALPLAAFAIIGGQLTPILTNSGGSTVDLLVYILILDLGVLLLSHFTQWRGLNAIALVCTVLWEFVALARGELELYGALYFIVGFGVIYVLVPALYNIVQQEESDATDVVMLVGNGLAHFGLTLAWMEEKAPVLRENWDAGVALIFACIFLVWSSALYSKNKKDNAMVLGGLSLTVLFCSLAIPLQLGAGWTSLAWSIEAAFLIWMSLHLRDVRIQYFAWPVMAAAYFWYLFDPIDGRGVVHTDLGFYLFLLWSALLVSVVFASLSMSAEERKAHTLLPFALAGGVILTLALAVGIESYKTEISILERFLEAAALIGGSYVVLWKARQHWSELGAHEQSVFKGLAIATQIVTLCYISYEFYDAVEDKRIFSSFTRPYQIMQVGLSIIWALYATTALVAGIAKRWKSIRMFGLIVLLIAVAKLTLIDFFSLGSMARFTGFTVLGILLVGSSFLYQSNKDFIRSLFKDS